MRTCNHANDSYVAIESKKIQSHCPRFIKWCKEQRKEDEDKYVEDYRKKFNTGWLRWLFNEESYTTAATIARIKRETHPFGVHLFAYPSIYLCNAEAKAERLLDMSRENETVLISATDFDHVFRNWEYNKVNK